MFSSKIKVWDLPLRLFHWLLVISVIGAVVTVNIGGEMMTYHFYFGYSVVCLIVFRIIWGLVGSRHARFFSFIPSPSAVITYLKNPSMTYLGHSPTGALATIALILLLAFQGVTGLFTDDDIFYTGPLANTISKAMALDITTWHRINANILIGMIILHVVAIIFYTLVKKQKLVSAMVSGYKKLETIGVDQSQRIVNEAKYSLMGLILFFAIVTVFYYTVLV